MPTLNESFSEPITHPDSEGSRQEHGAWNRDQGARDDNPPAGGRIIVTAVDAREPRFWFVAWVCGCTDCAGSVEALDARCPGHDAETEPGVPVELTPGVSSNLGHMCITPCTAESPAARHLRESA